MVDDSADSISLATEKEALTVLTDESISAQEKYDLLYDKFKDGKLTLLPFLLGLFTDDDFKTRKRMGLILLMITMQNVITEEPSVHM